MWMWFKRKNLLQPDGNYLMIKIVLNFFPYFCLFRGIFVSTYSKNWVPTRLHQTKLKIIDGNRKCIRMLGDYDSSRIYCAFDFKRKSNICMGDSGGPLMYYSNNVW